MGKLEDWLSWAEERDRYCGLSGEAVEKAMHDERVINALLTTLEVPGRKQLVKRSYAERIQGIVEQVEHVCRSEHSAFYKVEELHVLAAHIWRSKIPVRLRKQLWFSVRKEQDLLPRVAVSMHKAGFRVFAEVPMGRNRIDVVGHTRKGLIFKEDVLQGVELKNDAAQLKRGWQQMTAFAQHVHRMYLACTPWLYAEFLDKHARAPQVRRWDCDVLTDRLERAGLGLCLVEASGVNEILAPESRKPTAARAEEVHACLTEQSQVPFVDVEN